MCNSICFAQPHERSYVHFYKYFCLVLTTGYILLLISPPYAFTEFNSSEWRLASKLLKGYNKQVGTTFKRCLRIDDSLNFN